MTAKSKRALFRTLRKRLQIEKDMALLTDLQEVEDTEIVLGCSLMKSLLKSSAKTGDIINGALDIKRRGEK